MSAFTGAVQDGGGEKRWFKKGIAKHRFERTLAQANKEKLRCQTTIRLPGSLHSKYQPNQLLGSMGKCDIVMFALSPFFGKVIGKGRVSVTDIFGRVIKGIA